MSSPHPGMDFSIVGTTERVGDAVRAHVNLRINGQQRNAYGPRRPNEEAAQADLQSMRSAGSGMGRDEGFAAMEAEAKRLREGKAPREQGNIEEMDGSYRADIWSCGGGHVHGPRRAEMRRAEMDLEAMREASSNQADAAARRAALAAEAHRLHQQADTERRVELLAHRTFEAQAQQHQQQPSVGLQQQEQRQQMSAYRLPAIEADSESQSEWEPGEADDADVVYQWERFDDRGRPLELRASQQQNEEALPPIPEPRSPDEASLLLAQFRPIKRTPDDLKRLLEGRADPNIMIPTETYGSLCPLEKILMARDAHVPIFAYAGASSPMPFT